MASGECYSNKQGVKRMYTRHLLIFLGAAAVAGSLSGQAFERRATMRGGGGDRGKCTIEVVVDVTAEVEIRGDRAVLRNVAGQPPQWRRFECDSIMPPNPADFRFEGIDGRGRQTLVRDPRQGGPAVIRIDDPKNGSEGYTFDIMWSNRGGYAPAPPPPPPTADRGPDGWRREREEWFRRDNWRDKLFDRVRQDIEHVQSVTFPVGGDQYRLARTKEELNELQGQMASGRWDRRELDDVVNALTKVLEDNRLRRDDREVLSDDLSRLRELRDRRR
jgi:hypothetical protein